MLSPFILVHKGLAITQDLVTIRQYASWMSSYFDEYTIREELYLKTKVQTKSTYQYHPGTKIGKWFDKKKFASPLTSIYIKYNSPCFTRLEKLGMVEKGDVVNKVVDNEKNWWLRVYTVDQIALYIKSNIDKNFLISSVVDVPKQIKIKDISGIVLPKINTQHRSLF